MKVPRVYLDTQALAAGAEVTLPKDAAKYLLRVLRRNSGDSVVLFNGDGHNYPATLAVNGKQATVNVSDKIVNAAESPLSITLVQALAKGTKLDLIIQKATELGVQRIAPVIADRSVMQIDQQRQQKKMDHWHAIAISACTQCGRSVLPVIDTPVELRQWLGSGVIDGLLLHPGGTQRLSDVSLPTDSCTLYIGPEGGFSDNEITMAADAGIQFVTCGPRVLRTETAGFTAIAVLQSKLGDL
ncbi:MAG: 16S rRNA (uracil(1498)-N(3))-methyltransferase [Pseudomonadota bacterium]